MASASPPPNRSDQIDAFLASYNDRATPFSWRAAIVYQKHLGTRVSHP